jgi:hypothetical protein
MDTRAFADACSAAEIEQDDAAGEGATQPEIEEYFHAVVEAITDDALQLRTRSSGGEEAVAWMDLVRVPESERKYIRLGAPLRITIRVTKAPSRRRETQVRFLRPGQYVRPTEREAEGVVALLDRMQAALAPRR